MHVSFLNLNRAPFSKSYFQKILAITIEIENCLQINQTLIFIFQPDSD